MEGSSRHTHTIDSSKEKSAVIILFLYVLPIELVIMLSNNHIKLNIVLRE